MNKCWKKLYQVIISLLLSVSFLMPSITVFANENTDSINNTENVIDLSQQTNEKMEFSEVSPVENDENTDNIKPEAQNINSDIKNEDTEKTPQPEDNKDNEAELPKEPTDENEENKDKDSEDKEELLKEEDKEKKLENPTISADLLDNSLEYVPDEIIVEMKKGYNRGYSTIETDLLKNIPNIEIEEIEDLKASVVNSNVADNTRSYSLEGDLNNFSDIYTLKLKPGQDLLTTIELLRQDPRVENAEPNYISYPDEISSDYNENMTDITESSNKILEDSLYPNAIPNDPTYLNSSLWNLKVISAPTAWNTTKGNKSIKVGVMDSGIDYNHPDLRANVDVSLAWNVANDTNDVTDHNGHGTNIAGIIGAVGNNVIGFTGINWDISIVPIRISYRDTDIKTSSDIQIKGLMYAKLLNLPIVNMSYTMGTFKTMINVIEDYGGLFIRGAGNQGIDRDIDPNNISFIQNCTNIIEVANSGIDDSLSDDSEYGKNTVHLAAPGIYIYSTMLNNTYKHCYGTSMAGPHVAGVAALLKSYRPSLSTSELKSAILNNVDKVPGLEDKLITGGRLNAQKALASVMGGSVTQPINITLNKTNMKILKDRYDFLVANISPINASNQTITWTSSDNSIATVSASGSIKGIKSGVVTIIARTSNGLSASCKVAIDDFNDDIENNIQIGSQNYYFLTPNINQKINGSLEVSDDVDVFMLLNHDKTSLYEISMASCTGDVYGELYHKIYNENDKTFSHNKVASSSDDPHSGKNFLIKYNFIEGGAYYLKIRNLSSTTSTTGPYTLQLKDASLTVTNPTSIIINKTNVKILKTQTETLTASILPTDASNKTITWASSDNNIATVSASGSIKGIKSGVVTITARTSNGLTSSCKVVIDDFEDVFDFRSQNSYSLTSDINQRINGSLEVSADEDAFLLFASNAGSYEISTTSCTGDVYGELYEQIYNKNGNTYSYTKMASNDDDPNNGRNFLIQYDFKQGSTYFLKIRNYSSTTSTTGPYILQLKGLSTPATNPTSIIINKTNAKILKNQTVTLTAAILPTNVSNKTITWTSSDNSIATVSASGLVKGIKPGVVTVTARTSNGLTASCNVVIDDFEDVFNFGREYNYFLTQSMNRKIDGSLEISNDEDTFLLFAPNSGSYEISTTSCTGDVYGELYQAVFNVNDRTFSYRKVASNDDNPNNGRNFLMQYNFRKGAAYFLKIRNYSSTTSTTGAYTLQLKGMQ